MWEGVEVYQYELSGEYTKIESPVRDGLNGIELINELGFSALFSLGDENVLNCDVYRRRDGEKWLFLVYDINECLYAVTTEDPLAFTQYLKMISETCLAADSASKLADEKE